MVNGSKNGRGSIVAYYQSTKGVSEYFHCPVELRTASSFAHPGSDTPFRLPKRVKPQSKETVDQAAQAKLDETQRTMFANRKKVHKSRTRLSVVSDMPLVRRDELAVTVSRYISRYRERYYNIKVAQSDCPYEKSRQRRLAWKRIMTFLQNAVIAEHRPFKRFRRMSQTWFLLYNNTPVCPILRHRKPNSLTPENRVRKDCLEYMLGWYVPREPPVNPFIISKNAHKHQLLPDLHDVFEHVPTTRRHRLDVNERTQLLNELEEKRLENQYIMQKYDKTLDSVTNFWHKQATEVLRTQDRHIAATDMGYYKKLVTVDDIVNIPQRVRHVGIQTTSSMVQGFKRSTFVGIWHGYFDRRPNISSFKLDEEVTSVKYRKIPMPKLSPGRGVVALDRLQLP